MMGVAKLIGGLDAKPRRTIRVVLFANEEFGTSGSQAYVAANQAEVDRHVLGFEADFGAGPVWRLSSRVNPAQLPAVDQIFARWRRSSWRAATTRPRGGADLDGLAKLGMPMLRARISTARSTSTSTTPPTTRWRRWIPRHCASRWRRSPSASGWARSIRAPGNASLRPSRRVAELRPEPKPAPAPGGAFARPAPARESGAVAAATEYRTGCAAARGRLRPWVRSQARIRASGALAVAVNSESSARRRSSACSCSIASRAR